MVSRAGMAQTEGMLSRTLGIRFESIKRSAGVAPEMNMGNILDADEEASKAKVLPWL